MWSNVQRWRGVVLAAAAIVSTVWLAVTGQLILYIHPRYVVFTVVMALVALVLVVASFRLRRSHADDEPQTRVQRNLGITAGVLASVIAVAMIVVPPATLTSSTVAQRDLNGSGVGAEVQSLDSATSASTASFATFTVRDWASLLRQTSDVGFYASKPVDVVGFVTKDADDPDNVFYVSRFVITCCAVDAQPVGVPVYLPGWKDTYPSDSWVKVAGSFFTNPSRTSAEPVVVVPDSVTAVGQPKDPYLF